MRREIGFAILLAAGFIAGVLYLFNLSFSAGDVYPQYSSLRSDPTGSRLLFESLAGMPGIAVARNYAPIDFLPGSGSTILLLGLRPDTLADSPQMIQRLEKVARRGNRIVAAFDWHVGLSEPKTQALLQAWKVRIGLDHDTRHVHPLYFEEAAGWKPLDEAANKLLAIERPFGSGAIALFAASDDFSNESAAALDRVGLVTAALGPNSRIIFDEHHFGIEESATALGMVRRFRLTGAAIGLALLAALFIWRSTAAFPPPSAGPPVEQFSGRTSHAGLLTLLRRHVAAADLPAACWQEWLATNRRSVSPERVEKAAALGRSKLPPLEALREIQTALRAKGEL